MGYNRGMSEKPDISKNPESHSKADVRAYVRELRGELGDEESEEKSRVIMESVLELPVIEKAESVFCYVGCGEEVRTIELIKRLLEKGKKVLVPKIAGSVKKGRMRAIELTDVEVLKENELGILEPKKGKEFRGTPTVTITPCVAATGFGARLGQGGGFYDRYFEGAPLTVRVVLAFECQILENLPGGGKDEMVDMVITEKGSYQRDEEAVEEDDLWEST